MYILENELKLKEYEFHQRKYLPWDLKQYLTERRIVEWYENNDCNVYISFSGGLDSTVLLHFVRKVLGNDIPAVFCDTGLEYPELREFVKGFDNVIWIKPKMNFRQVIDKYGYPVISKENAAKIRKLRHGNLSERYRNMLLNGDERGKAYKLAEKWKYLLDAPFEISEQCCDVMKKRPFHKYSKETGQVPFIGITQDESFQRERQYNRTGCNVYKSKNPKSQPLGFWTKQDILKYVKQNNLEICSVYGSIKEKNQLEGQLAMDNLGCSELELTGVKRTGCMFCMFGCHLEKEPNRFQQMKKTHPKQYTYCMEKLGLKEVLDYIGVEY